VARVSKIDKLEDATLLTTSPMSAIRRSDAFERLAARAKLVRGWSDCYGYALVATGRAEIMLDSAMNLWDCAPLLPLLTEAGGHFFDWSGKATIHGRDAAATNAALYRQVLDILRNEQKRS
jgi:fructose-1,6-bisphosphatase/inositol monophosphatase family enzyme